MGLRYKNHWSRNRKKHFQLRKADNALKENRWNGDDPRNADGIGEKEILVVSFGTSYNSSRVQDIRSVEDAMAAAFPDWSVRRAFTSQRILSHIRAREQETIDNMTQALERAAANGVRKLVLQPTHLMCGTEYDAMEKVLEGYRNRFEKVAVAQPLLGEVCLNADKEAVARAVVADAAADGGFANIADAAHRGTALVLLGHGTAHGAQVSYSQMQIQMEKLGYGNVFVGTVDGRPEGTSCTSILQRVRAAGYRNVILRPLMVVAGGHAIQDMAGAEPDSWRSMFLAAGCFESVVAQLRGLGSIPAIWQIYITHTRNAIASIMEGQI